MKIGIDLDSVLAEILTPLNDFYNHRFGTNYQLSEYVNFSLSKVWGCTSEKAIEAVFEFYHSPYMKAIPVVAGAVEAVDYLRKKHELIVITSRSEEISEITHQWINQYFPNRFAEVVLTNQFSRPGIEFKTKGEVGKEIGIEAMIDDNLDNLLDCAKHGINGYLFEAGWNRYQTVPESIVRIKSWTEVNKWF